MKAISLNQIAKEEIKGTGYEIRVNGQKVVSEKGMPDRFYGEIRILKPVIDRDYMLVSDGMTEKAIRSCMKKNMTDKQIQKRFDEAIAKFRIILDPEKTKRLIQKYIEKDRSDSHADVKNASRKVLEQITITMKAEEE